LKIEKQTSDSDDEGTVSKGNIIIPWDAPRNLFISFIGYNRHFFGKYSKMAEPLLELIEKGVFEWTDVQQTNFELLKKKMNRGQRLAPPMESGMFTVQTDFKQIACGPYYNRNKRIDLW
jgi:hypothetical protein